MNKITERLANKHAGELCTLNGRSAKVVDRLNEFATIGTLEEPFISVEFAWPTVERVINNGGKFRV